MKFISGVYEAQDLHDDVRVPAVFVCPTPYSNEQVGGRIAIPAYRVTVKVLRTIPQLQPFGRVSVRLLEKFGTKKKDTILYMNDTYSNAYLLCLHQNTCLHLYYYPMFYFIY